MMGNHLNNPRFNLSLNFLFLIESVIFRYHFLIAKN